MSNNGRSNLQQLTIPSISELATTSTISATTSTISATTSTISATTSTISATALPTSATMGSSSSSRDLSHSILSQLVYPSYDTPTDSLLPSSSDSEDSTSTHNQNQPVASSSRQNDSIFGVSLHRELSSRQLPRLTNTHVGNLATSRPPIRRLSSMTSFEPNLAVEAAQQVERQHSTEPMRAVWSDVLKLLNRLENTTGESFLLSIIGYVVGMLSF